MPIWIANQGDTIPNIAFATGFFWKTIWNHPENAALKADRKNPNVLYPKDEVFVPELQTKTESRPPEKRHKFLRKGEPPKIIIKLLDEEGNPQASVDYVLDIEGKTIRGKTSADGEIETYVPGNASTGKLFLNKGLDVFEVLIGTLDPIDEVRGIQQRLSNLGYECYPFTGKLDRLTRDSLVNFQGDQDLPITGKPDEETKAKLLELTQ